MGKQWKQCQTLFLGAPKSLQMVTAAMKLKDAYSLKESYDQPRQHIQRHYFANKGLVKAMVFPVVMCGCESCTINKAERWRIDAFELWYWRRLLRVPWTARRSNQSILKEISPGSSLEGLMLRLKPQSFGHLMWRADSFEETLILGRLKPGGEGDDRGWDGWMASRTQWTWVWVGSVSWWWTGRPGMLQFMGLQRFVHDWVTELNWFKTFTHFLIGLFVFLLVSSKSSLYSPDTRPLSDIWVASIFSYAVGCLKQILR